MNASQKMRRIEERKQSATRIAISAATFVLLLSANLIMERELSQTLIYGLSVIVSHTVFSLIWHRYVCAKPLAFPNRIHVAMVVDITATTLAFYFAARFGAFFYPVFLWLIVGYGLRYGKRSLLAAAITAFVEFGVVLEFNTYWQANMLTGTGLWVGILILPTFFLTVMNRLGSLNRELEIELIKSQAAEKAKGDFLANMSHEIRTPLNGILGMAQILKDAQIDPEGREHLRILRRSASSLLEIVNDILDFSKISSGMMTIEAVAFDLRGVLDDVAHVLHPAAAAKGIAVELEYPPQARTGFVGDPTRIRQILMNLAGNAVKFTETGSVTLSAAIGEAADGQATVVLKVRDTGIGIPADRLPVIFEEFEQADTSTSRNFGGTGLGLSITNHLVRMMKGEILAESAVGYGSAFSVTLSMPTVDDVAARRAEPKKLPRFELAVLVAEDNAVNQLVIRKLLNKVGIKPVFADNGELAIAALESQAFDLIFMDVRMPVMDGLEATRLIRARPEAWSAIPIIALTADADSSSAKRCLEAGMDLHLGKPVILAQAIEAMNSLVAPVVV